MIPWTIMDLVGKFRVADERMIRFLADGSIWCNSTDFMVPWYRTHNPNGWANENATVL